MSRYYYGQPGFITRISGKRCGAQAQVAHLGSEGAGTFTLQPPTSPWSSNIWAQLFMYDSEPVLSSSPHSVGGSQSLLDAATPGIKASRNQDVENESCPVPRTLCKRPVGQACYCFVALVSGAFNMQLVMAPFRSEPGAWVYQKPSV